MISRIHTGTWCLLLAAEPARAGMPSFELTEIASLRLSAISFFLLAYLLASLGVQQLWNLLHRDFPALPRLAYPRALLLVFILGLGFHLVLVMIAGTRELMTPTAWERAGLVHKIAPDGFENLMAARRHRLERLRQALWVYAGNHQQRLPASEAASGLGRAVAEVLIRDFGLPGVVHLYTPEYSPPRR